MRRAKAKSRETLVKEDPELMEAKVYGPRFVGSICWPEMFEKRRLSEAQYQRWLRGVEERALLRRFNPQGKAN